MSKVLDRVAEATASWLVQKPRQVMLTLAVLVIGSLALLPTLKLAAGLSDFIADEDPSRQFLREVEKAFVSDDVIYVAYEADDPFSKASLEEVRELGRRLKGLDRVDDVVSLATVDDVSGADSTYRSIPLVPEEVPDDAASLAAIRTRAWRNHLISDGLLSKDSPKAAAMVVRLVTGLNDLQQSQVVNQVRKEVASVKTSTKYQFAGAPVVAVDAIDAMQRDLAKFIPVADVVLCLALLFFTRRVAGMLLALINATVAVVVGMAILAVFGSLTTLSTIMPPMLMILSVATIIHFLTEYARNTHVVGPEKAAEVSLRELLVPAFMCELTTAVSFVSFGLSRIPALREFGWAAAVAVMAAFVTSFLIIAVAAKWLGAERLISSKGIAASARVEAMMDRYTDLAIRRPRTMLAVMGGLVLVSLAGTAFFTIDHDNRRQFDPSLPIRQATDFINDHLGGSNEYIVSIQTTAPERFFAPGELTKLEQLQAFLEGDVKATSTASFVDYVKLMNRGFNDDADAEYRVPTSKEQVAQLVLLNGDDRLFDFIDRQARWVRVTGRTKESGSAVLTDRIEQIEQYLLKNYPASAGYVTGVTGSTRTEVSIAQNILDGQLSSFLLSMVLIFFPIALVFGSFIASAYTIPSNLFPILACMGLMGWAHIPLDIATSMIAAIVLGIAVDDTIHLVQTMRTRLADGATLEEALRFTMATKGVGAVWITLIVTCGFGVLVVSDFRPTSNFGLLTAFAMLAGVAAEIFLLPPLMIVMRTRLGVPLPSTPQTEAKTTQLPPETDPA